MLLTLVTPSLFLTMATRKLHSSGVGARVAPAWAGEDGGCPDILMVGCKDRSWLLKWCWLWWMLRLWKELAVWNVKWLVLPSMLFGEQIWRWSCVTVIIAVVKWRLLAWRSTCICSSRYPSETLKQSPIWLWRKSKYNSEVEFNQVRFISTKLAEPRSSKWEDRNRTYFLYWLVWFAKYESLVMAQSSSKWMDVCEVDCGCKVWKRL